MMTIIVIGSANTDLVMQVKSLPKAGETVLGDKFMQMSGGKGANQAVAIARCGVKVYLLASIGIDHFGDKLIENYKKCFIDTSLINRPAAASGVAMIYVAENGENSIAVSAGSNLLLSSKNIYELNSFFALSKYVIAQLEIPIDVVLTSARLAKQNNAIFVLNPAPAQALPKEIFSLIDIITPNQSEATILTGIDITDKCSAIAAAQALYKTGVKNVIITLGVRGALLYNNNYVKVIPGYSVKAIDTTAAGDTFNGALVYSLFCGNNIIESIIFANKAAALSVTRVGAQSSIPTVKEIEYFSKLIDIDYDL